MASRGLKSAGAALARLSGKRQTPMERLAAARALRETAEELEREAVVTARAAGASWRDVAEVYGVTKQAAQQRFRHLAQHGR